MKTAMPPLYTPFQLAAACREHLDMLVAQYHTDPYNDPLPHLKVLFMEPNTASTLQMLHNRANWKTDYYAFADITSSQRFQEIGANYARVGRTLFAAFFAAPVWKSEAPLDANGQPQPFDPTKHPKPADAPNRTEALFAWALTMDNNRHAISIPVTRDAGGAALLGQPIPAIHAQAPHLTALFESYATTYAQLLQRHNPGLFNRFRKVNLN